MFHLPAKIKVKMPNDRWITLKMPLTELAGFGLHNPIKTFLLYLKKRSHELVLDNTNSNENSNLYYWERNGYDSEYAVNEVYIGTDFNPFPIQIGQDDYKSCYWHQNYQNIEQNVYLKPKFYSKAF